jgi:hypothetical protein
MSGVRVINYPINQRYAPALLEDVTANRPLPGFYGRIFIDTQIPNIQRDTGTSWQVIGTPGGGGSVTSVGLALPGSVFSVSSSPVTGAGTLTGSFVNQNANLVFASPDGGSGLPSFRALVANDLGNLFIQNQTILQVASSFNIDGLATVTKNNILSTVTDALFLVNTAPASVGGNPTQQYSPALHFQGQGWKTAAPAASLPIDYRIYLQTVQGVASPFGNLVFDYSVNGGAYVSGMTIGTAGLVLVPGNLSVTGTQTFTGNTRMNGLVGIGVAPASSVLVLMVKNLTGNADMVAWQSNVTVQSDVVNSAAAYLVVPAIQNAAFTLPDYSMYSVSDNVLSSGSATITKLSAFKTSSSWTAASASNVYGFWGRHASGTNIWNLYIEGAAINYINNNLLIGTTTDNVNEKLQVNGKGYFANNVGVGTVSSSSYSLLISNATTAALINTYSFAANSLSTSTTTSATYSTNTISGNGVTQSTQTAVTGSWGWLLYNNAGSIGNYATNGLYAGVLADLTKINAGQVIGGELTALTARTTIGDSGNVDGISGIKILALRQNSLAASYSGTVTNFTGLLINDITGGSDVIGRITTVYAIWQKGASDLCRFDGSIRIGNAVNANVVAAATNRVKINVGGTDYYFLVNTAP